MIVFSNVLNVEYSTVKYSTGDNVTTRFDIELVINLEKRKHLRKRRH